MAGLFCFKIANILSRPPQNFLLNDYYENLLGIFKQKISANNKKTCVFLLEAFGELVKHSQVDLIKLNKIDTLVSLTIELLEKCNENLQKYVDAKFHGVNEFEFATLK